METQLKEENSMGKVISESWRENKADKVVYPNGVIAKQVWENIVTGDKIIDRYNMVGELIFTNRHD